MIKWFWKLEASEKVVLALIVFADGVVLAILAKFL